MRKIKNILSTIFSLILTFSLVACGVGSSGGDQKSQPNVPLTGESNILIAYFTWADNTVVSNPDDIDVDASTSASVLAPGNTAIMAQYIEERTGGELFSIIVEEPYSSDYNECLSRANREKAQNARPKLKTQVVNMEEYDIVFLGFPNWWYTVPMAIHSFLESYSFDGKTIIPFCAHGTGGIASSVSDIRLALPNSTVLDALGIYRDEMNRAEEMVNTWLDQLGFEGAMEQ